MNTQMIADFFSGILHIIQTISIIDILDIFVVTIIFYLAYKFVQDRRAGRLALGIILVVLVLIIGDIAGMRVVQYISKNLLQVGIIAVLILFQPELRSALEKMGGTSIINRRSRNDSELLYAIHQVVDATADMALEKTGALIVFERNVRLGEIASTGSDLDAKANAFLLRNIFFNKAPLHDGAVIISGSGRITAASCLLPLSEQTGINKNLGTRHRAAIGITETCDCVSVVVSEETGVVSLAVDGKIKSGYNRDDLREELITLIIKPTKKEQKKDVEDEVLSATENTDEEAEK